MVVVCLERKYAWTERPWERQTTAKISSVHAPPIRLTGLQVLVPGPCVVLCCLPKCSFKLLAACCLNVDDGIKLVVGMSECIYPTILSYSPPAGFVVMLMTGGGR